MKFLTVVEQRASHFHFELCPANFISDLISRVSVVWISMRPGVDTSSFRDRNVELVPEIPEMGGPWSPMHLTDREIVYAQGYKRKKRTL